MLKCNILNEIEHDYIDFHSLPIGETFVLNTSEHEWIGMKVKEGAEHEFYTEYVMDLSYDIGRLYGDVDKYDIIRLIDLKVVEDEGDE